MQNQIPIFIHIHTKAPNFYNKDPRSFKYTPKFQIVSEIFENFYFKHELCFLSMYSSNHYYFAPI